MAPPRMGFTLSLILSLILRNFDEVPLDLAVDQGGFLGGPHP